MPIAHSLRGPLLRFCSDEYLAVLHRGVFQIQTAIIIQILVAFLIGGTAMMMPAALNNVQFVGGIVNVVVAGMLFYGWWQFSELDPGYTGQDTGTNARKVVRASVVVGGTASLFSVAVSFVSPGVASFSPASGIGMLTIAAGVVSMIANVVQYFSSMLYIQWLARRIPNEKAQKRAKKLMWLGPVLMTVGILLAGLGPVIALVLYWNLLDWVRKDLKAARSRESIPAPATS